MDPEDEDEATDKHGFTQIRQLNQELTADGLYDLYSIRLNLCESVFICGRFTESACIRVNPRLIFL